MRSRISSFSGIAARTWLGSSALSADIPVCCGRHLHIDSRVPHLVRPFMARAKSKGSTSESSAYGLVSHVRHGRGTARMLSSEGDEEHHVRDGVITLGEKRGGGEHVHEGTEMHRWHNGRAHM